MATSAGAFFAGIGTTFAILALGFGGGLMMANSALKEPGGYQSRTASEAPGPVRVILPTSAEAAQPPQQASPPLDPPPTAPLAKAVHAPAEKQVEKAETRKAEAQERERKRRHAQRQARRLEEVRARQQRQQQPRELEDAPIMAFGGDSSPRPGREWFGN
jgi:hypothetical protein